MNIRVTSPDDISLHSLYEWLIMDDDVVRATELSMGSTGTRSGAQSPLDVINIVLSNATAIASLVVAYSSWRQARPARPAVTFRVGEVEVTAHDASEETVRRVIAALSAAEQTPAVEAVPEEEHEA